MTNPYRSPWMTEELDAFRDQFRRFLAKELAPHVERWRQDKIVDRVAWRALGDIGALLPSGGKGRLARLVVPVCAIRLTANRSRRQLLKLPF